MLSKGAILAAVDLKTEDIQVDEWGGVVRVIVMSGLVRDQLQTLIAEHKSGFFFEAALVALTASDEDGNLLFTPDDIPAIQAKNPAVVAKVADVAIRINGLGAKATKDAEKNSESGQSDDSGSDLASSLESPSAA